jgi:hypothetical protein
MTNGFRFPPFWWGKRGEGLLPPTHSVLDLLDSHVLDTRVGALFWALLARRASLLLVGGWERGIGKTTTLTALTGFFPPDTDLYVTRGAHEDFSFLSQTDPERTYLMVGEFSDHTPGYLWGPPAARLLRLNDQGYRVAGTMHAEGIEHVIAQFGEPPVSLLPAELPEALQLVIFLRASEQNGTIERRLTSANWLQQTPRGPGGMGAKSLMAWSPADDSWTLFSSPDTWADLARWGGTDAAALKAEVGARQKHLDSLLTKPARDFDSVRETLLAFRM